MRRSQQHVRRLPARGSVPASVTLHIEVTSDVPRGPAVYAMYGGEPPRTWVAYVGMAGDLNRRLVQHFVNRDSSVVTGTAAAGLNVEWVRLVRWWEDSLFADPHALHAAELVAFDVLDPALRSRGTPSQAALDRYRDDGFRRRMEALFRGAANGELKPPRAYDLDRRLREVEARLEHVQETLREVLKRGR